VLEAGWVYFGTSVDGSQMAKADTQQAIVMASKIEQAALRTNLMEMRPKLGKDHHYSEEREELEEGESPSFAMRTSASFENDQSRDLLVMTTIPPRDLLHDILAWVP
jgi:hypothetical protein